MVLVTPRISIREPCPNSHLLILTSAASNVLASLSRDFGWKKDRK